MPIKYLAAQYQRMDPADDVHSFASFKRELDILLDAKCRSFIETKLYTLLHYSLC